MKKVCALWKYTEWWPSSRSNDSQKKFFETLYTFKHTIEQSMRSVKVHWVVGFKQEQWLSKEVFPNIIHIQTKFNKVCALWKYIEWWASSRSNGLQKKFFKTIYTFKRTIEQSMRSVKVHWAVGFKQKQWLPEEVFWNITHIQTYNWTKFAFCESTLSVGFQAEALGFRRSLSKHPTHSIIQLNNVCALLKYTEWLASSRSNGFQGNFFQTSYTFKQNLTKYALCESTLSGGLQAEVMAFRRSFSKHYTYSNIQLNKVCALWTYSEWWASSRSNGFQEKIFKTIYTFKRTIEQSMRSVKVHWAVGFKQKQWLPEEVFWNITHIQTYNWTKFAFCESTLSVGFQAEALGFRRSLSKHPTHSIIQLNNVCALLKYTEWLASSRSNGFQKKFFYTLYTFKHTIEQSMRSVKVHWVVRFKEKQCLAEEIFWNIIHIQTYNCRKYALCESTVSGGLQAEAMTFRRSFSKQYTHSNVQLNKVCALWKYTEQWASSRSNGFRRKFLETLHTFKHTIE